ncbi:hypothetical protein C8J57DRAFT_1706333 [Mycena rebaudengoi]|nr:hypothetical protein C8J57DRAFT_1706333 [Mycena rebaudengoi]
MRAPRCLEDTTLLLEEPLASSFAGQDDVTKTALLTLFQKTAKKVQAAPGGPEATNAWLDMAFDSNPLDHRRFSSRASREFRIAISFVRFYWCLYSQQDTKKLLHTLLLPGYKPKQGDSGYQPNQQMSNVIARDAASSEPTSPLTEVSLENVDEDNPYPLRKRGSISTSPVRSAVSASAPSDHESKPTYRELSKPTSASHARRLSHTFTTPERSPPSRRPVWPPAHLRPPTSVSDSPDVKPLKTAFTSPPSSSHAEPMDVV